MDILYEHSFIQNNVRAAIKTLEACSMIFGIIFEPKVCRMSISRLWNSISDTFQK